MAKKIPEGVTPDLYKEYKRLADRADKRLLRLERLAVNEADTYGNVLAYAYKVAQKQTKYWSGDLEKPRYARDTPTSDKELKKKIRDIQKFLSMPTSTKRELLKYIKTEQMHLIRNLKQILHGKIGHDLDFVVIGIGKMVDLLIMN